MQLLKHAGLAGIASAMATVYIAAPMVMIALCNILWRGMQ